MDRILIAPSAEPSLRFHPHRWLNVLDRDVHFKTRFSQLNERQRVWFATAIVAMILADGDIDRNEVNFIVKLIKLVPEKRVAQRLKKFIRFRTVPPLGGLGHVDRKLGMTMIIDLIRIAVADNDFAPAEKEMIQKIGKDLGFNEDEIRKLVMFGFELMSSQQGVQELQDLANPPEASMG